MAMRTMLGIFQIVVAILLLGSTIAFQVTVKGYLGPYGYPGYSIVLTCITYFTLPCLFLIGLFAIFLYERDDEEIWKKLYTSGMAITEALCFASFIISILSAADCPFCWESSKVPLVMMNIAYGLLNIAHFILALITRVS
ncbi:hypothetical protein HOLleu_22592 [Holothuria leucospilota]|uniref:MARVEL domain-containing protein n=1 Tax=Holothuria leucospilota TaxID=206669 RepID=A0A9Q1BZF1_HOLLE|nr:hypothetical protein HOLleu_22592 [Holothuria leucospilota]